MTVSIAPDVSQARTTEFNPRSAAEARRIIELYQAYLLEELERTGVVAPGLPVALYLKTLIVWHDDVITGFCSLDLGRYAIELIYIEPTYRRQGIARMLLAALNASCPGQMRAKAPLTPSSQALVDSLGIPSTEPGQEEVRHAARSLEELHRDINAHCRHRRGNPSRPCRRCYRSNLLKSAEIAVSAYVAARRALARPPHQHNHPTRHP